MEEAISTVELVLRDIIKNSADKTKSRFGLHGKYYHIKHIPSGSSKINTICEEFKDPTSSVDMVKKFFGIQSEFILITSKSKIDALEAKEILSILTPAANACGCELPFFVQISQKKYITFIGVSVQKSKYIHYSSYINWNNDHPFNSLQSSASYFKSSLNRDISDVKVSSRIQFTLDEENFLPNRKFTSSTFYAEVTNDPIKYLNVIVQTDPLPLPEGEIDIYSTPLITFTVDYRNEVSKPASTLKYMDHIMRTAQIREFSASQYDSIASKIIESIFKGAEKDPSPNSTRSVLKSAPDHFILNDVVAAMAKCGSVTEAGAIWLAFLRETRRCIDKGTLIPGVGSEGPVMDDCLIAQKLQMVNFCIANRGRSVGFTEPEDTGKLLLNGNHMIAPAIQTLSTKTEDQINESVQLLEQNYDDQRQKALLQSQQLKSDIAAFKDANEGAVFEDFVRWYSPADFDETSGQLSKRMADPQSVWHEMWEKEAPMAAKDQPSIINFEMQCELAMDYLESLLPTELLGDLVPVLLSAAYYDAYRHADHRVPFVKKLIGELNSAIDSFHASVELATGRLTIMKYIEEAKASAIALETAAHRIAATNSLLMKLNGCTAAVDSLAAVGFAFMATEEEKEAALAFMKDVKLKELSDALFVNRDYCITCDTDRLFVSTRKDSVVVATQISEDI